VGELLRDDAAEGDAEHVDAVAAERVEHRLDGAGDAGRPARPRVGGRLADPGRVERDRLYPAGGQLPFERPGQVEAGAQPGHQQPWRTTAADREAQPDAVDLDEPDLRPVRRRRRLR
jgi:hypothetical protein